ncbi:hypothetical protein V8E55_007941 [Tylopilus felleus]
MFMAFTHTRKTQSNTGEEGIALVGADERHVRSQSDSSMTKAEPLDFYFGLLGGTWLLLGGLHLIAWNFHFPTEAEKILWRVASLVLVAGPPASFILLGLIAGLAWGLWMDSNMSDCFGTSMLGIVFALGVVSRTLLVALMLASLRSLPPTAYQTVSWTAYIPHL